MVWSTWSGVPDDGTNILVVDDFMPPNGSSQQAHIGPNSTQNCLLDLFNLTSGEYFLFLYMYIPAGSNASLNIQGETETNAVTGFQGAGSGGAGIFNSDMMYFDGTIGPTGIFTDFTTGDHGEFPLDEWFTFQINFDLDNVKYHIEQPYEGMTIDADPVSFQGDATLGGINLTSTDENTNYWIDLLLFLEPGIIAIDDFSSTNFKLFPNPVTDILNIESEASVSEIEVYNTLGKQVLKTRPNAISPSLDMSALSSGVYLVSVTIGNTSKIFKVVK